jgi:diamine N-acetyltransferase
VTGTGEAGAVTLRSMTPRPATPRPVTLRPVTPDNVRQVCDLRVAPSQERFVTSAAVSLAEAYVHPQAWCRAVCAGDEVVGFVMLYDAPDGPGYTLWRLLVDERHQGQGHGRRAVLAVLDHVRSRPAARSLKVGARRGEGSPRPFYERLGFAATGEVVDGDEDVLALALEAAPTRGP